MFGFKSSRSKKLDSRVRYQHQSFTKKLDQARNYKRTSEPVSEDKSFSLLSKLGLKTVFSKIVTGAILAGLIYLVFVPNFLSPRHIEVQGVGNDEAGQVRSSVEFYLDHAPFYAAQYNLIFLSKNSLEKSLLTNPKIYKVTGITKSIFHRRVSLTVEMKVQKYIVNRNNAIYSAYNDGSIQDRLNVDDVEKWLSLNLGTIKIKDNATEPLSPGVKYLGDELIDHINQLQDRFKPATNNEINYFAIPSLITAAPPIEDSVATGTATQTFVPPPRQVSSVLPLQPDDIYVFAKKQTTKPGGLPDYKVIFNAKGDLEPALSKLQLLFSQMAPDRYVRLFYVDVRFENRAFLCLTATPCAQEPSTALPVIIQPPPTAPATSTSTATNPKGQ